MYEVAIVQDKIYLNKHIRKEMGLKNGDKLHIKVEWKGTTPILMIKKGKSKNFTQIVQVNN